MKEMWILESCIYMESLADVMEPSHSGKFLLDFLPNIWWMNFFVMKIEYDTTALFRAKWFFTDLLIDKLQIILNK